MTMMGGVRKTAALSKNYVMSDLSALSHTQTKHMGGSIMSWRLTLESCYIR